MNQKTKPTTLIAASLLTLAFMSNIALAGHGTTLRGAEADYNPLNMTCLTGSESDPDGVHDEYDNGRVDEIDGVNDEYSNSRNTDCGNSSGNYDGGGGYGGPFSSDF